VSDREGVLVPQQLLKEQQLKKEQREAARVEKEKPGNGLYATIIFETKDRRSLPDAEKPPKKFTRQTSEACSIPGHGIYLGHREGGVVPQQLLKERQLEKEQIEAAQVKKDIKNLQQSEKEIYSLNPARKARFADDISLCGVIKTNPFSQAAIDDQPLVFSHVDSVLSAGDSE
jgi:hypothetical protein